jgi:hypothetical protein
MAFTDYTGGFFQNQRRRRFGPQSQETPAQRIARLREEQRQRQMQSMNPAGMPARQGMPVTQKGWDAAYGGVPDFKSIIQQRGQRDIAARPITANPLAPARISQQRQRQQQQPFVPTEPSFGERFGGPLGDAGVAASRAATTSPTNPAPSFIQSLTEGLGQFTKSFTENERYLAEKGIQEEERFKADQLRDHQMQLSLAGEGRAVEEHEWKQDAIVDREKVQRRIRTVFGELEDSVPEGGVVSNEMRVNALNEILPEFLADADVGGAQVIADWMGMLGGSATEYGPPIDYFDEDNKLRKVMVNLETLQTVERQNDRLVPVDISGWSKNKATDDGTDTSQTDRMEARLGGVGMVSAAALRADNQDLSLTGAQAPTESQVYEILHREALQDPSRGGVYNLTDEMYQEFIKNPENIGYYKDPGTSADKIKALGKALMAQHVHDPSGTVSQGILKQAFWATVKSSDWVTDEAQEAYVNALNFINPVVRFLSGAQMTNQEAMRYYSALIPMPGEPVSVTKLKRERRTVLLNAMGRDANTGDVLDTGDPRISEALVRMGMSPEHGPLQDINALGYSDDKRRSMGRETRDKYLFALERAIPIGSGEGYLLLDADNLDTIG